MNTITLTIAATPDNLKKLAMAFGDEIDETLSKDHIPAHRKSTGPNPPGTPVVKSVDIPEEKAEPEPEPKTEAEQTVTLSDIRAKASVLTKGEHRTELKALLDQFGAARVTELRESDYAAFYKGLEAIG